MTVVVAIPVFASHLDVWSAGVVSGRRKNVTLFLSLASFCEGVVWDCFCFFFLSYSVTGVTSPQSRSLYTERQHLGYDSIEMMRSTTILSFL